jgi:hypothetical protein
MVSKSLGKNEGIWRSGQLAQLISKWVQIAIKYLKNKKT